MESKSYKENTNKMQKVKSQQAAAARTSGLKRKRLSGVLSLENVELNESRNSEAHSDDGEGDDTGDHFKRLEELEAGPTPEKRTFDDSCEHFKRLEELEAGPVPEKRGHVNFSLPTRNEERKAGPVPEKRVHVNYSLPLRNEERKAGPVPEKRVHVNYSLPLRNDNTPGHAYYDWAIKTGVWEDWIDEADWHESKLGFSSSSGK